MTFLDYFQIIAKSVAETGYDHFLPSRCIPRDSLEMDVLEVDLTESGEEQVAKTWAAESIAPGRTIFLAYRSGERTVTVVEIQGSEVVQKQGINVQAYGA